MELIILSKNGDSLINNLCDTAKDGWEEFEQDLKGHEVNGRRVPYELGTKVIFALNGKCYDDDKPIPDSLKALLTNMGAKNYEIIE